MIRQLAGRQLDSFTHRPALARVLLEAAKDHALESCRDSRRAIGRMVVDDDDFLGDAERLEIDSLNLLRAVCR